MDEYDDFFDTPRKNVSEKKSTKTSHNAHPESTTNENSRCNKDFVKSAGKPPSHPNSRPISAANKRTLNGRTSPTALVENFADGPHAHGSRCVIEAKVPCDSVRQDNEDGSYSDDCFAEDDDGSSVDECSGRRSPTPRTLNSDQSKEISVAGIDARPHVTENIAQDLSDCSGSFTDDTADSDDDVIDVSPLNTPHCPSIPTASSSVTKDISQSSKNEPIRLLQADRDSLDLDTLLQTVLHMEKQGRSQSRQSQMAVPSSGSRRNYSFTNERIQAIDKENHRLMTRIMKHANDTKKAKAKVKKLPSSGARTKRLSSAAVNRAKQQKEIEAENLVIL